MAASAQVPAPEAEAQEAAPRSDAEILSELGLKDPDTMVAGDDFAAFLKERVPLHLRQRALRRLWRTNPVLANLDGLVDHGEDFSNAATVQEGMQTAYQVGRGMMGHLAALARAQDAEAARAEDDGPKPEAPTETQHAAPAHVEDVEDEAAAPPDDAAHPTVPRRSPRFTFADHA